MKDWLQYLIKEDGRSGYVQNNVVSFAGTKRPLTYSPIGWQELAIAWERNMEKHGLTRNFSLPFSFVRDGAMIVRDALYGQSVEEKLFVLIQQLTLKLEVGPSAVIGVVSGSNPFSAGTNTGTITGTPGQTVYVKVAISGLSTDTLFGNIGGSVLVNMNGLSGTTIYGIPLDSTGVLNYNLFLSGGAAASISIVNSLGGTVGFYKWLYKYFYKGELDLSKAIDDVDKITVPIMEGGLSKLLKAKENTVYTIPFDEDAIDVLLDGIDLRMKQNWQVTTGFIVEQDVFTSPIALPLNMTSNEGTAPYVEFNTEILETAVKSPDTALQNHYVTESTNWFCKIADEAPDPIDLNFTGKLRLQITTQRTVRQFQMKLWKVPFGATATTPGMSTLVWNTGLMVQGEIREFDFSSLGTITANAGDRFFFTFDRNPGSSPSVLSDYQFVDDSTMAISFTSKFAATICKAFTKIVLFRKLVEKITGSESYAKSLLLEANTDLCITCGDAIRGLEGAAIHTKLSDFYLNADAILMAGIGIESEKIALEDRPHFYDPSNPIDLGEAKDWSVSYADDIVCNTIKAGSADPSIEDLNGKFEFNGSDVTETPLTRQVREYNIVSPYKSAPYEIEITRLNLDGKTTTDNNNDNDVFNLWVDTAIATTYNINLSFLATGNYIVFPALPKINVGTTFIVTGSVSNNKTYVATDVVDEGTTQTVYTDQTITVSEPVVAVTVQITAGLVYPLKREAYSLLEINGDPDLLPDNIFNVRYSPRRIRDAHNRWIRSMLFGFDSLKVNVTSGNRNITLKTILAATTVDEDLDLLIGDMGDRMFKPFYFDFTIKVPIDLVDIMEANPNRCFKFSIDGIYYTGFSIKTGLAPNTLEPQQFKLLATDENDMTDFIV